MKKLNPTTTLRCAEHQKSADLIYIAAHRSRLLSLRLEINFICYVAEVYTSKSLDEERYQQDATHLMFIIKLSQHVSGIIMPIIRRTIVCTAA